MVKQAAEDGWNGFQVPDLPRPRGPKDTTRDYGSWDGGSIPSEGTCIRSFRCYNLSMKTFLANVMIQVEIDGPDEDAMFEVIQDYVGEGDDGFRVHSVEVLDFEELE